MPRSRQRARLLLILSSFDELAADERGAGADKRDEVGCVDGAPEVLGGRDQLEGRGQASGLRPRPWGDLGPVPHGREGPKGSFMSTAEVARSSTTASSPRVPASLLTVWSHVSDPRSRERGGRTTPQKSGNWCKPSTIPDRTVRPSDSRFRSITKDLGRLREMPSFALSRRQRGFESRWGHNIKSPLTRPDTSASQSASPRIDRQGRTKCRQCRPRQSSGSARPCSAKDGSASAGGLVLSRARISSWTARRFGALQRTTNVSATTERVRSAFGMRDVDRPRRWPATSRPFTFQRQPGGKEMINELID